MLIHKISGKNFEDFLAISDIFSKATGPVVTKFYVVPPGDKGTKVCSNRSSHMANIATMPISEYIFKNH